MRLYHHPFSFNARRAVMAAFQLGLSPELVLVDLGRGEQRNPEFLAKNPNGSVPVLEDDDGFILWESNAIMQYLADKTPGHTLYPTELRARADVNRWLFWSAHHFTPAVSILCWEHVIKPILGAGDPDPARVARGMEEVTRRAGVLNEHLATRPWIAQDTLTLADLAIAAPLTVLDQAKLPINAEDHSHIMAWLKNMQDLDAWKRCDALLAQLR
ncbi:MAG TPA: glutathione S-transferase family protein [Kofleriaceae bacterium]|nr:glutathione S-transferase family protein [Kofleriaceae bacterium]